MNREVLFSSATGEHSTSTSLFTELDGEFHFNLDAAAADNEDPDKFRVRKSLERDEIERRLKTRKRKEEEDLIKFANRVEAEREKLLRAIKPRVFNAKVKHYFTIERSCFDHDWRGPKGEPGEVYINPVYGRFLPKVMARGREQIERGHSRTIVWVLPSRTDTRWFHDYCWDRAKHRPRPGVQVRFRPGREKFGDAKDVAPFPTMIVVFKK